MPLILPGNVASATAAAYSVANSCRFNNDDSAYMHRTPAGGGTSNTTFTWSIWIKRTDTATAIPRLFEFYNTSSYYVSLRFRDDVAQNLDFYSESNGSARHLRTNRGFRDVGAWYHIVMRVDTTNGTADDRLRMYVNGVQETSFAARTNPSSSEDLNFNGASDVQYVARKWEDSDYFDGYMAEVCYCDGQSLAPTSFGEFDENSPTIWKPIDVSGLTFGTNGFYLDFEDSANLGNDANGGTDLTEVNLDATDSATDTPTNNFATINPLDYSPNPATLENGNTSYNKTGTGSGNNASTTGTLGVMTGKWYYEFKPTNTSAFVVGMIRTNHDIPNAEGYYANDSGSYSITNGGKIVAGSESGGIEGYSYSADDIFGMAYDLDNGKFYVHVNGTYLTSGDPTSGSTGTGSIGDIALGSNIYVPFITNANYDQTNLMHFNFGNPPYAISSGNTDGNGYGNFEYAVPSGYYALCTKNLAEYG